MLNMSVANACIRGSLFDLDEPPSIPGRAEAVHTLQLHQLPLQTQDVPRQLIAIEDAPERETIDGDGNVRMEKPPAAVLAALRPVGAA